MLEYELFDNLGRMTQMSQITDGRTYTSKYTYNFSGALVEEEYPSGRKVKNEFESDGDLSRVTSQKNSSSAYTPYVSNFSYTASGGISQMKLGNGRWETSKFNTRLQVTELGLGSSATNTGLWKTAYEYGEIDPSTGNVLTAKNTGNIARQTLTVPGASFVQSYKYDSLYRLTEATEKTGSTQNWTQSWNYDRFGNRVGFAQNVAGSTDAPNPSIDQNTNRFSSGQGFTYDLNGNLVVDNEGRQFTFNGDNKQTVVRDAANNIIGQYFFDGEGKRVKKITNSETTVFVYSSGKLIAEYSTQLSQSPSVNYTTTDHLGSPRIITDQFGQVKSRRDFMPFGEDIFQNVGAARTASLGYSSGTDDIKQKFTGYLKDNETDLDFAEARMYENRFGRFTAVDPLLASGKSAIPQTFNRYIYAGNNPVLIIDPNGTDWYIAFNYHWVNGKVELKSISPDWRDCNYCGRKWGTTGTVVDNGVTRAYNASWVFHDPSINKFVAVDKYEKFRGLPEFATRKEAMSQVAAWDRQAAINFAAGFANGASLAVSLSGADSLVGETNSQMYAMGQRAGTGASIAGAITGVGLTNALVNQFGKAGVKIAKSIEVSARSVEGVYDLGTTLGKYVGQSKDIMKRVNSHFAKGGKLTGGELETAVFHSMPGSTRLQREVYEHYLIVEKYGIENLTNVRRPMGGRIDLYNSMIDDVIRQFELPR